MQKRKEKAKKGKANLSAKNTMVEGKMEIIERREFPLVLHELDLGNGKVIDW